MQKDGMNQGDYIHSALMSIDDAELGRRVKQDAVKFSSPSGNLSHHVVLACGSLIACCYKTNGVKLEQTYLGNFVDGEPVGDFKITVERIDR